MILLPVHKNQNVQENQIIICTYGKHIVPIWKYGSLYYATLDPKSVVAFVNPKLDLKDKEPDDKWIAAIDSRLALISVIGTLFLKYSDSIKGKVKVYNV